MEVQKLGSLAEINDLVDISELSELATLLLLLHQCLALLFGCHEFRGIHAGSHSLPQ